MFEVSRVVGARSQQNDGWLGAAFGGQKSQSREQLLAVLLNRPHPAFLKQPGEYLLHHSAAREHVDGWANVMGNRPKGPNRPKPSTQLSTWCPLPLRKSISRRIHITLRTLPHGAAFHGQIPVCLARIRSPVAPSGRHRVTH